MAYIDYADLQIHDYPLNGTGLTLTEGASTCWVEF